MKTVKAVKVLAVMAAAAVLLTGCRVISQKPKNILSKYSDDIAEAELAEYTARDVEITQKDVSMKLEAEECNLNGNLKVDDKTKGFSGKGYVTGFFGGKADYLIFVADIPASQHYDITVCAAAEKEANGSISVNEKQIGNFVVEKDVKKFTKVTYYGVFMNEGMNSVKINKDAKNFDIDYIEIKNDTAIYAEPEELDAVPVSPNSSYEAKDLLRFIKENNGKNTITGQYASNSKNTELDYIFAKTGRYPAIRFGDIGGYGENDPPLEREIKAAEDWDAKGGIVGFMWYWRSPGKNPSVYANETDFKLEDAVTEEDISQIGISELQEMCRKGKIAPETLALVEDIDAVAQGFDILAEEGIPIIWRPIHEGGGKWYWWGASGPDAYKWLYNLMFDRMTKYFGLDNLIWVWNGQNDRYVVDEDKYDIAAMDIYLNEGSDYSSRSEQYQWLKKVTGGKKLLALSECSAFPDIDDMRRDRAVWSFFGLWFGDYLEGVTGEGSKYFSENELNKIYNAENTITLDEYSMVYGGNTNVDIQ